VVGVVVKTMGACGCGEGSMVSDREKRTKEGGIQLLLSLKTYGSTATRSLMSKSAGLI
jgi:hypothetical protein